MSGKKKKITILIAVAAAVIAGIILALFMMGNSRISAVIMRLIRLEGTVSLQDADGNLVSIIERMKLHSGNKMNTGQDGLLEISLDDTKIVTIVENSSVEFVKNNKELELNLTKGRLFFNVFKPLAEDEAFDIRTSTMIVGIRGTSGWVDAGNRIVYGTTGTIEVTGVNDYTGAMKKITVKPGQKITTYLYNERKGQDSIEFFLEETQPEDLPIQALDAILRDPDLLEKVMEETGWTEDKIQEGLKENKNVDEKGAATEEMTPLQEENADPISTPEATLTPQATANEASDDVAETRTPELVSTAMPSSTIMPSSMPTITPMATPTVSPVNLAMSAASETPPMQEERSEPMETGGQPTEAAVPTVTPLATPTATPIVTPTATPIVTPTATPTPTPTPTATPAAHVEIDTSVSTQLNADTYDVVTLSKGDATITLKGTEDIEYKRCILDADRNILVYANEIKTVMQMDQTDTGEKSYSLLGANEVSYPMTKGQLADGTTIYYMELKGETTDGTTVDYYLTFLPSADETQLGTLGLSF